MVVLTFGALETGFMNSQYSNQGEMFPYAWIMYAMIIDRILRKGQGQRQVTNGHYT